MLEDPWRRKAKCFGLDPNMFVPSTPGGTLDPAKNICNGRDGLPACPVRVECNHFANEHGLIGVYGGVVHSSRSTEIVVIVQLQDARPRPSVRDRGKRE
jgi:hypothetical protein